MNGELEPCPGMRSPTEAIAHVAEADAHVVELLHQLQTDVATAQAENSRLRDLVARLERDLADASRRARGVSR